MKKIKSWVLVPFLGLLNLVVGYFVTKILDSFMSDDVATITELPISSIHWSRYIPAIFIGITVSILLYYLCKNLNASRLTRCLAYMGSSIVVIGVFLSGTWYKDPIYTFFLPEDDYYTAEKTNFVSSNGTLVAWSDKCVQSGRVMYCYVNLKNISDKDQSVSINTGSTYILTGEKAHVRVSSYGKLGNQDEKSLWNEIVAPSQLTITYGLKFELPEPTKFETVPNLRVALRVAGYNDLFSMTNRPLVNVAGH
ncbi:hypothetical protein [Vibrio nigripulchritudo]|uniref:hypothetical protein n=1 Tax=Vibrio nigripulchritudo TaxID=28173 RepID=UPI0005F9A9B1|nr:hypothetical protein [Vibrio nigripulchritudo]KJY78687.1 hypothetical protein TW74_11570 [Vibrio nigripulchritudo]